MSTPTEEPPADPESQDGWRAAEEVAALIGHELRTPLTVLYTCLQLLSRVLPSDPDEPARHYVEEALTEARQMNVLTSQLMEASSVQAGDMHLHFELVELRGLIRHVADQAEPLTRGQRIDVSCPSREVVVRADRARLEQVLMNLLINAITYAPGTDRIDVRVGTTADQVCIEVQDYGPGIRSHRLARVARPFYQEPRADRPSRGGLGLGLFLSGALAEMHGGRLQLDSREGRGCTVRLSLPASTPSQSSRVSEAVSIPPTAQRRLPRESPASPPAPPSGSSSR